MRKKMMSMMLIIGVAIVILCVLVKIINFHTDGSSVVDGDYTVETIDKNFRLDVYRALPNEGTKVWFYLIRDGAQQKFHFKYLGDGEYVIEYLPNNMCIGLTEDGLNVSQQAYIGKNEQKWKVERVINTHYFRITSAATGKTLRFNRNNDIDWFCDMVDYDENDQYCKFLIY